jgi:hypothetical protein
MAVRASKAQYEHAFSEHQFYKMNSVNSTKLYMKKIKNFLIAPNESMNIH